MRLQSLCDVPLVKILRYLDERSLLKLSVSSSDFHNFIRFHRCRLVERRIGLVMIEYLESGEYDNHQNVDRYEIWMSRKKSPSPQTPHHTISVKKYSTRNSDSVHAEINDGSLPMFAEWFATTFANTEIGYVIFEKMPFHDDYLVKWSEMIRTDKIKAYSMGIKDTIRSPEETNAWILVCKALNVRKLQIDDFSTNQTTHIWTEGFRDFITTLEHGDFRSILLNKTPIEQMPTIPTSIYQFPPTFFCHTSLEMTIESLKKGIQLWYEGGLAIERWTFLFAYEVHLESESLIADALGVPYTDMANAVELTNVNQKRLMLLLGVDLHEGRRPYNDDHLDDIEDIQYYVCRIQNL